MKVILKVGLTCERYMQCSYRYTNVFMAVVSCTVVNWGLHHAVVFLPSMMVFSKAAILCVKLDFADTLLLSCGTARWQVHQSQCS